MGSIHNHPTRITHLATAAVEAALLGEAREAGCQPLDALIDFGALPLSTDALQGGTLVALFNTASGRAAALQMAEEWSNAQ